MAAFRDDDGDGLDDATGATEAELRAWNAAQGNQGSFDEEYFADDDGDGFDDSTGLRQTEFAGRYRSQPEWTDVNRDGRHDTTGQTQSEHASEPGRLGRSRADARDRDNAQPGYDEYIANGGRTADLDAGRRPQQDPSARGGSGRDGGGGGSGGGGGVSDFDRDSADIPIWGWLSGASGRRDAANAQTEADRARSEWDALDDLQYTADDLAVDYEEEGYVKGQPVANGNVQADAGSIEAQRDALRAMQEVYQQGGMTAADRARHLQAREMAGQQMRATREADTSQLQARGMGGSGQALVSMLGAQQQGASALAGQDASMLQDAQRRALQAMQASGQAAGQMRGQSYNEGRGNADAIESYNRWNTDREQGWTGRNTDRRNQSRESMAQARRDRYEQDERQAAGKTNQWAQAAGGARQDQQRQDEQAAAGAAGLGTVWDAVVG